ncbi:MAG: hypothetical protein ACI815_001876 [Psychroserpens sp.]
MTSGPLFPEGELLHDAVSVYLSSDDFTAKLELQHRSCRNGKERKFPLSNGDWIETEWGIDGDDLPEKVRELIKAQYGDFEIVEIEEAEHHLKCIFYDVEFKRNGEKKDIEFRADGQELK